MTYIDDPQTQKANMDYIRCSMGEPLLEKGHELDLARQWRDKKDERALHKLVKSYTRLVISVASRFRNYGLPMGDLIQEGNVGLMLAAERFDPERDIRFSTYATWWIRASIQDYVLRNWSIVRTGTTSAQKSLFFNYRRLRAKVERAADHEGLNDDSRVQIANELNIKVKDVEAMEGRLSGTDQSLNAHIGQDGEDEWQSLLSDERPNPEEVALHVVDSEARSRWLNNALHDLSDREQTIIRQRHLGQEVVTLEALGKELGVSKERVRQLEVRAMEKLKTSIENQADIGPELFSGGLPY
ncbi:MAG TPA: RNA polymerase factor sigma-32 [Alphaproteobacteria bacterium]|nr:RNA polymerase factor sigma-32 [Alphaproteobacteria bacterium]USO06409.1 MAG: RNA polymerase factor sigma-32 [Rhodospirillales bacterium]HOO81808.1 RNA polymerase factor sigma-32 [Alphaproteobacteria bacterium]